MDRRLDDIRGDARDHGRLLVAVTSCDKYEGKREACRRSWFGAIERYPEVDALFVVGIPELPGPKLGGDTLYVPCSDDYESLPQKTWHVARWAVERRYEHLFKCDDDTYLELPRLVKALPTLSSFVGYVHPAGGVSGGAGYYLAAPAFRCVAASMGESPFGAEDVIVTHLLGRKGIKVNHDPRFSPGNQTVPDVFNNQITSHYLDGPSMLALFDSMNDPAPRLFRLMIGTAEYGAVGVNGYRGFAANGTARVECPAGAVSPGDELISAHASSDVKIECERELMIRGFLDAGAGDRCVSVAFSIDGAPIGGTVVAGDSTAWMHVEAGEHVLRATVSGNNSTRYSVWQVRRLRTPHIEHLTSQ